MIYIVFLSHKIPAKIYLHKKSPPKGGLNFPGSVFLLSNIFNYFTYFFAFI